MKRAAKIILVFKPPSFFLKKNKYIFSCPNAELLVFTTVTAFTQTSIFKELASKAGAKIHTLNSNKQAFFEIILKYFAWRCISIL